MTEEAVSVTEELQQDEAPQLSEAEQKAMEGGWRPKSEWEGDPDAWVDAREFNFRGELMERIKTQTRKLSKQESEIGQLKTGFQQYQEHARKLAKAEYDKQLKELKEYKKEALASNDFDAVVEADEQIGALKEEQKTLKDQPEPQPEQDPRVVAWVEENEWYAKDVALRGAADAIAHDARAANPDWTPEQVLDEVSKRVKEEFPAKFKKATKMTNGVVESSTTPRSKGGYTKYTKAHLNDEQRKIGKTFVACDAIKSLDEYAQQLAEMGELDAQRG